MRSKKRTIGILIVVIVVLLGFAGSLLVYRNKLSSENNSDVYTAVDKEIYEKIVNDAFKNASLEERKEIALNVLNTLESENKIKKDSIKFNDEYNCYFFLYSNGAEGSIILDDCFSSLETNNNINEDNSKNDSIFDIEKGNFEKSISSNYFNKTYIESGNNNANGYIKENLSTYNLTYYPKSALIIDCMDNDYERNLNNVLSQTWTTNDLKTDVRSNVTVEEFKTILNGSDGHSGYDFINIDAHGFIDYNGNPTVFLQEEMNPFENNYSDDRDAKRIGTIFGFLGGEYYLKYNFFEYYYYNALTDEIIWLSCCKGYTNDILVGTLANDCNAKAVIGLTDTVIADYDNRMRDFFIHKLLFGYTVNESLKEAKSVYGKDDAEWYLRKYNKKDNTPAECKNYNGGDETLVELVSINTNGMLSGTVTDESNNPIKDAEIIINNVRGMSHGITATTNENGEYTLECPQDSYKIVVKADGYEVFETDDFVNVVYGEENIFNITLKKVIEPTDHIETTLNYTAVDLIEKNIPEIISLMNGEYQIIKTENDGYIYIQNQSVLSGMEFYVQVSGDDIISANNGEEIHSDTLKAKLESGELTLDGIQVNKSGKVNDSIQADMDYKSCSKVLGNFNCIGGTGGYLGGDIGSISYNYNDNNAKVILNFEIPEEIYRDLSLGKISSVSAEKMKSYNPKLKNVVIRNVETNTNVQTEQKSNTNNFNINDYNGMFYPNDSNTNAYIIINSQSEKNVNIEVNISNPKATHVSQVIFSGNVDNNVLIFEEDDGFGRNSYTLEFLNQKVYLTAKCIESYGIWGIPELNKLELTKQSEIIETQIKDIPISDIEILWAVNKYLEENKGHLGTYLTVSDAPYCPTEHMYSNETNWSCPINLSWESYSANEIAGAYPHFAYVDKSTLKCTLTANYETVVEFDLKEYIK